MKSVIRILALALAATVMGCSTTMSTEQSGFLSSYSQFESGNDGASSSLRAKAPIDSSRVRFDDVEWRMAANAAISDDERASLLALLKDRLQRVRELPTATNGRPVIIRAAITRVETVSPLINTIGTLLLIGPLDRGGAAVEIEALDPDSGQQLAALRMGYFAPLSDLRARFSKLAPAEIAVKKAADDFLILLIPSNVRKP